MDSTKKTYSSFPFEWTVKSTSFHIRYRKAYNINEIDEIFCSIINAKGNKICVSDLGSLLGFNLQDLAELDILNIYLKELIEYNLIEIKKEIIQLTDSGQEALHSKLKYKYFYAKTELLENQTARGEKFDFPFEQVFDLINELTHENKIEEPHFENLELKQKLQFQLFGDDFTKGKIIELYGTRPKINYKNITLQCEITALDDSFQFSIYRSNLIRTELQFLVDLPENEVLKSKLIREGMYHHVLSVKSSITLQDIELYCDLWNWKELAANPKIDWSNKRIFNLFVDNGDGSVWNVISEKAPLERIKAVIKEYEEYWNWPVLTERFDIGYIKDQIEIFNWDFEELSYKETEHIVSLLSIPSLKERGWDWNYLSKSLPDKFIEEHFEDFAWDFYEITESKYELFKNACSKYRNNLDTLISKKWNWEYITKAIELDLLYNHISEFADNLDWQTVMNRFFDSEAITAKCLEDESFKTLLKKHLPSNFIAAHQKYLGTPNLVDFFEQQNLIQWESKPYINGFDTNENVVWDRTVFQNYHYRITTDKGFLNVSQKIIDYRLIEEFPDFAWNWEGISQNKNLISNTDFIEKAFAGEFPFSNNLFWDKIKSQSTFNVAFWNKNLEAFHNSTESEKQILFWHSLTQEENQDYIFENSHFPWNWSFITLSSSEETILDSFEDAELFEKWDWQIATRKLGKETILNNLEEFARCIDWKFLINEVFTVENELAIDKQLPRIAACLSVLKKEERKELWKELTAKYQFANLFPLVEVTAHLDIFEWDWVYISYHKLFPTDTRTINKYKNKINWRVFSESNAIHQKFNPVSWTTYKEWLSNTDLYLSKFADFWDWSVLSKNDNVSYNRFIINKHKGEKWDWEYLSEFGGFLRRQKRDSESYLEQVVKRFQFYLKFEFLSRRHDINIESRLILAYKDKTWDWQSLSENENVEISNEVILDLKDKDWNWKAISKRKNLTINNETLLQILDKDWDWNYLSVNPSLEFNTEFVEKTKNKCWDWKSVSRHKTFLPTLEILSLTKSFDLDWIHLSQHSSLNPNIETLAKFETKWDWKNITRHLKVDFSNVEFIERFADKWDWLYICEAGKLALNNNILIKFKDFLKWDLISANTNIDFSKDLIQQFKTYWNWPALKRNMRVEELLGNYIVEEINKSPTLTFIDRIDQQWSPWKGAIYHFTHIDNAVEIIKNGKIFSRNKATIKGDAAGNVVHRRGDAHNYARFYFRPHTPTQFYNEFLGKNISDGYHSKQYDRWVSWYEKARGLGYPKCPIPIFFKFSLSEVLFKYEKQCCISNGNMQTGATQFGSIDKMINKFGFDDLYYTPGQYARKEDYKRYRNYAQQEFLIKEELSFFDLKDFEIICPTNADRMLLIKLLGHKHQDIYSNIIVDCTYYNNENPRVRIEEDQSKLYIKSEFNGKGYFILNTTSNIKKTDILEGDVSKVEKDKIIFNTHVSLRNMKQNIRLNFLDESNRNWFIYANGIANEKLENDDFSECWGGLLSNINYNASKGINLLKENGFNDIFSHKIRHYKLEVHTNLVCNVFEKYFVSNYSHQIDLGLFRTLLILHDIGKTQAFVLGNKSDQYEYTKVIITDLWNKLPFSERELKIVLALVEEDYLGEYFQNKLKLKFVTQKIEQLAKSCDLSEKKFLTLYMIYYQCDIASYTADEGGIKFLEDLFEYKNGKKVFDKEEGLLKMSSKLWQLYKELNNVIDNGN